MKNPNALRRILLTAAALVAIGGLSLSSTGCTSATSAGPTAVSQAAPAAPTPETAPASVAAAPAQATHAAAGPNATEGQKVVQSSCIGRCHESGLLNKRFPASSATAIAADMGSKVGLNSGQKAAVVAYFAQ